MHPRYARHVAAVTPTPADDRNPRAVTEEHSAFRKAVRDVVEREIAPHVDEWERAGTFPPTACSVANCSGFYGDRLSAMREVLEGGPSTFVTGDWPSSRCSSSVDRSSRTPTTAMRAPS